MTGWINKCHFGDVRDVLRRMIADGVKVNTIVAGCPVGGVVLDPFFGSGTTGQVAQDLGRKFIGIEFNLANKPLQDERLRQPDLELEAA